MFWWGKKKKKVEQVKQSKENFQDLIQSIKTKIKRKAIIFETGESKATNEKGESWIGKVCWQNPEEQQPICKNTKHPMTAIATLFIPGSDYVPKVLKNIKLITVFMDDDFWNNLAEDDLKDYFVIRTYENLDNLVQCNYSNDKILLPHSLSEKYVDNEFPHSVDLDIVHPDSYEQICDLENKCDLEYYDDIFEENKKCHKLGGYPSTIQNEITFNSGCEFAFQISSDDKAKMNIVDSGNIYFGYNPKTKEWSVKCDFY